MLSTVNVPPPKSSTLNLPVLARLATSAIATLRPWIESWSASRITGTIRPSSTATATPMLTRRFASRPSSVQWALNVGFPLQRLGRCLHHERDVAEPDPLLVLVVPLGLLAERHQAGDVDLHLDVGVGRLEGPRHLGGDALAHLGRRDEDLVGAGRELDRGGRRGARAGRRRRRGCGGRWRRSGCRGWRRGGAAAAPLPEPVPRSARPPIGRRQAGPSAATRRSS